MGFVGSCGVPGREREHRKIKGPPAGSVQMVGWIGLFRMASRTSCQQVFVKLPKFSSIRVWQAFAPMVPASDERPRRRVPGQAWTAPRRRDKRPASEVLRRPGAAGCEQRRPRRSHIQSSPERGRRFPLRARPGDSPSSRAQVIGSARRRQDADCPAPRGQISCSAACPARQLSRTRRRHARRCARPTVRRDWRSGGRKRLR